MTHQIVHTLLIWITICITYVYSQNYNVVFEKAELTSYNKEYGKLDVFNFRKINKTTFALNCTFDVIRDLDLNNARARLEASKFYSNKYVIVPTRLNLMLCKTWKENLFGIQNLKKNTNIKDLCYVSKNSHFTLVNYMPNFKYPPYAPFGRYRIRIAIDYNDINVIDMSWFVQLVPK